MAQVTLTDAFIPTVYGSYFAIDDVETTNFYQAGIIATDPLLDGIAREGGKTVTVPFWKDLDQTIEQNYSNDDISDIGSIDGLSSGTQTARKAWVNKIYGAMDLVKELAGSDPMVRIRDRFSTYWRRRLQRRIIAICNALIAENIANDSGDMVVDISGLSGDAAVFNQDCFVDAAYGAGDHAEMFRAIAVHSLVKARMVKNDEIITIPDSDGKLTVDTYKGRVVVTDDGLPTSGSGANRVYTSILFGENAIGFGGAQGSVFGIGQGIPQVPTEVYRLPLTGNGGGAETLIERNTWLIHPFGYTWIENTLASGELSPTDSDLATSTHWSRVVNRKQVPLAFIKSKA